MGSWVSRGRHNLVDECGHQVLQLNHQMATSIVTYLADASAWSWMKETEQVAGRLTSTHRTFRKLLQRNVVFTQNASMNGAYGIGL